MSITGCSNGLIPVPGTGYNKVNVPGPNSRGYTSVTDQLLYEIWQTLLLLLAAQNPPGMVPPILFTIGDGGGITPAAGTTSFRSADLLNKEAIVIRNGIQMQYFDGTTHLQIIRFNDGTTNGGFDLDPANPGGALTFANGDSYQIFPTGANTTIAP